MTNITQEYIKVPKIQYFVLKNLYELNKKQQDMMRIYEVEENIKNIDYKAVNIDDFINSI